MGALLLGIGLVFVFEGLVFALAPNRLDDLIETIRSISPETRRIIGLSAVAVGVVFVWIARSIGI
ncbi:MAG: DUF2065 domain-containing protein [Pseudomonadota bacterium]